MVACHLKQSPADWRYRALVLAEVFDAVSGDGLSEDIFNGSELP